MEMKSNFRKYTSLKAPGEREGGWKLKTISRSNKVEGEKRFQGTVRKFEMCIFL